MPEEDHGDSTTGKPNTEAFVDTPVQPAGNKAIPSQPANNDTGINESQAAKIAEEIKAGEKWLIGIGITTLAINTIIALIYVHQLREMRGANELTRTALGQTAQNSIDSSNQFQVQLRHYDASLGQEQVLAAQAAIQTSQTTKLANDTHDLAASAGKQADASKVIANQSTAQAIATNSLATAADKSNANAVEAKRPWVGMTGTIVLTKVADGPHQTIEFSTEVKNFGGSPAFSVVPMTNLVIGDVGTDIRPEIEKACKFLDINLVPLKVGEMVFPGDTYSLVTDATPDASPRLNGLNPQSPIYFFPGCVSYFDGYGKVHHTSMCQWTDAKTFGKYSTFSSCSRQFAD